MDAQALTSFDALTLDLCRTGYLRGPDHRNPAHQEQLALNAEQGPAITRDARTNSDASSCSVSVSGARSPRSIGSLRGPDHRRM